MMNREDHDRQVVANFDRGWYVVREFGVAESAIHGAKRVAFCSPGKIDVFQKNGSSR